LQKEKKVPVVR